MSTVLMSRLGNLYTRIIFLMMTALEIPNAHNGLVLKFTKLYNMSHPNIIHMIINIFKVI